MLPAESPAVPFVTASVVACSTTWIEPPALALELPAVALTTAKTRTAAAAAAAGTSRRFISLPSLVEKDKTYRVGTAVSTQNVREPGGWLLRSLRTQARRDLRDRGTLGVTHTLSALPVGIGDLVRKVENEALVIGELLWCRLALE